MGGGDPGHHRRRAVLGVSRRDRARLRPPAQSLSAHPDRRSRDARTSRPTASSSRSASRCSNCRCPAGTGRSPAPTPRRPKRAPRARCGTRSCRSWKSSGVELTAAGIRLGYVDGPEGQTLRMVERPVDLGADGKFLVSVAGDATRDFRRDAQLRLLPRRHLRSARHRAAADHDLPGPLRPCAAEAHFGIDRRHPLRPRRAAGGRISRRDRAAGARDQCADRRQPRNRRARAHPCRQSRPRHQDAAVGHRQRGFRARGRSLCDARCWSRPT